jgi:hypothetical protein
MRNEIVSSTRKKEKGSLLINRQGNECPTEIIMPLLEEVLKDGTNFVDSWGGRLYLVYLPAWTRYADPGEACVDDRGDKFLHDQALSVARNVDVPVIDITPAFDAHPDPLSLFPFRLRGHYSEAGYRVVADTILQSPDLRNRLLAD